ncbi:MAG: hypothetical protein KDD14_26835, partial [Saprospiraceae bacterium]|nr:hypothetical protein [Saprospiraceae bacterium]
ETLFFQVWYVRACFKAPRSKSRDQIGMWDAEGNSFLLYAGKDNRFFLQYPANLPFYSAKNFKAFKTGNCCRVRFMERKDSK